MARIGSTGCVHRGLGAVLNRIQRNKLKLSKWTAVAPRDSEKHFLVTQVLEHEDGVTEVVLEAVYSKREYTMPWTELKDDSHWQMGWR